MSEERELGPEALLALCMGWRAKKGKVEERFKGARLLILGAIQSWWTAPKKTATETPSLKLIGKSRNRSQPAVSLTLSAVVVSHKFLVAQVHHHPQTLAPETSET